MATETTLVVSFVGTTQVNSCTLDGKSKVVFAENRNVADGANTIVGAIRSFLNDHTIPYEKVAGHGSDGAAVMTGVHNGVGVQLKQVSWCTSSR